MNKFLFTSLLISLLALGTLHPIQGQSIQTGIEFYEDGNYERALRIFEQLQTPEAYLLAGKSYYGLNNFLKSRHFLSMVKTENRSVLDEAKYTRALVEFQLENFATSLDLLYELNNSKASPSVSRDAYQFYQTLIGYLTLNQRHQAFKNTKYQQVRFDLVEAAIGRVDFASANALFNAYKNSLIETDTTKYASIQGLLSDSAAYWQRYNPDRYPEAPSGIAYNLGVALPAFDVDAPQYEISQQLYFGIQLAVETFNSQNSDAKVFLSYQNTNNDPGKASEIANNLVWNEDVDAILGPLFSEVAVPLSQYAEEYEIPMLTPLANSDSLNLDLSYTYQLNPTFAIQGQRMAQFAIQNLGYDTLAVIAEKGSLGEPSAAAFLDEARKLGGEVVRYHVEDLASQGYDISEYVKYFDPEVDTVFNYNIDAVYAPFTGNIAETLINSLMTNLEAMGSNMTILGSEEWETVDLGSRQLADSDIYYTKTFEPNLANTDRSDFQSAYRLRFDIEPNEFAYIGYDAANVLLETLERVKNPAYLKQGLKELNNYRGLIMNVSFRDSHINQEVKIKKAGSEGN